MKVAELITHLQTLPQDFEVVYCLFSERVQMKANEIEIVEACQPRPDGLVQDKRPDMPTQLYVCFPGN